MRCSWLLLSAVEIDLRSRSQKANSIEHVLRVEVEVEVYYLKPTLRIAV